MKACIDLLRNGTQQDTMENFLQGLRENNESIDSELDLIPGNASFHDDEFNDIEIRVLPEHLPEWIEAFQNNTTIHTVRLNRLSLSALTQPEEVQQFLESLGSVSNLRKLIIEDEEGPLYDTSSNPAFMSKISATRGNFRRKSRSIHFHHN